MAEGPWERPPRMPLGVTFRGECRSGPEPFEPDEKAQREFCNCGYARGNCDRFPSDASFDAVRFSAKEDESGRVGIVYVFEKNHTPAAYGVIGGLDSEPPGILVEQVRVFLADYLRRRESRIQEKTRAAATGML